MTNKNDNPKQTFNSVYRRPVSRVFEVLSGAKPHLNVMAHRLYNSANQIPRPFVADLPKESAYIDPNKKLLFNKTIRN